jgi:hypothetical protein
MRYLISLVVIGMISGALKAEEFERSKFLANEPVMALLPLGSRLWVAQEGRVFAINQQGGGTLEHQTKLGIGGRNRLALPGSGNGILGATLIESGGKVLPLEGLVGANLVGTCRHPSDGRLCFLTEDGKLLGMDISTKAVGPIFDQLPKALGISGSQPRMRGLFAAHDRLYVVNDVLGEPNATTLKAAGRLAEWDWRGAWRIIETSPFVDVTGIESAGGERHDVIFALGYDEYSAVLRVRHQQQWKRYRLPWREPEFSPDSGKIREIGLGKWLVQAWGNFYLLQPPVGNSAAPRIRALSGGGDLLQDVCAWQGKIVLAGGQDDIASGSPQSLLEFTTLEKLAAGPKVMGKATFWRKSSMLANQVSDPLLIQGFDKKTLHLNNDSDQPIQIDLEIDATGTDQFAVLYRVELAPRAYVPYVFPQGYSASWLRLRTLGNGVVTGEISME